MVKKRGVIFGILIVIFLIASLNIVLGTDDWYDVEVFFENDGIGCGTYSGDGTYWIETTMETGGQVVLSRRKSKVFDPSEGNVGNCSEYAKESNMTCCPIDYYCNRVTGKCEEDSRDLCENFLTKELCNAASTNEGERTIKWHFPDNWTNYCRATGVYFQENGMFCSNNSECFCEWNNDSGKCESAHGKIKMCAGEDNKFIKTPLGTCTYTLKSSENLCDSVGKIILTYEAVSSGDYTCTNPAPKEYPCTSVVVVPFFTLSNIVISIMGIFVIYCFFGKKLVK